MKLRFRKNSMRLRLNQRETAALASGETLEERVEFPGGSALVYRVVADTSPSPAAEFSGNAITVRLPEATARAWEHSDDIGVYYRAASLEVAIEKDLECTDLREEERDPYAYPRKAAC
jgi:hypothetical protein